LEHSADSKPIITDIKSTKRKEVDMFKLLKLLSCLLLILWMVHLNGWCQPNLSGNLSGNLGPGTWLVIGNCTVPAGQTLTIAPGTTLLFPARFFFYVYGGLEAQGTATDSIKFLSYSTSPSSRQGGLRFIDCTTASHVAYWRIDNGYNVFLPVDCGGCVYVQNATVTISHTRFTRSHAAYGGGVYADSAILTLTACEFAADTCEFYGGGLYAQNSQVTVTGSGFYNNRCAYGASGGGMELYYCNSAQISDCIISGNNSAGT
jgi:hypothetical protein